MTETARRWEALTAARDRQDDDATRKLVDFFEHSDVTLSLEAARELARRDIPDDVRDRVVAYLAKDLRNGWHTVAALRALVHHPCAVELAEPLLRVDVVADESVRTRAYHVLAAIEFALARCCETKRPPPDQRFRALAAEAARLDPDLAAFAEMIEQGFRFFDGERVEPRWRMIEHIDDDALPLIVAGVRLVARELPDIASTYPPGLTLIHHQYGGLSCNQEKAFGYVLALPDDSPMRAALVELNNEIYGGRGDPMESSEIALWNERLAPLFDGTISEISEGLLFADARPAALLGLELVRFGTQIAPWRYNVDTETPRDMIREGHYTDAHERALVDLEQRTGLAACTAVISENSD
jgi:hypothetical protein